MKIGDKLLLAAAVSAVALVPASKAMIGSLYHGFHGRVDILIGGIGFVMLMGGVALALAAIDKWNNALLKLFLLAFLLVNIYFLVRPRLGATALPLWTKGGVAALLLAMLFYLMQFRVREEGLRKTAKAIVVSSIIFALSPLALAWSGAGRSAVVDFAHHAGTRNALVLILDETSPEYAPGFIRELREAGLYVRATEVAATGKFTLNAIPGMLSQRNYDDVAPCSGSALCGGQYFDFGDLSTSANRTDIVGFYHPYCAIKGLRSCFRQENVFAESSGVNFGLLLFCSQFNVGRLLPLCEISFRGAPPVELAKQNMTLQIEHAPFWRQGGLLFVHYPLPHPSMTPHFPSLKVEYEGNVAQSERMVARLAGQMVTRFGADFTILITSDHALRIDMWCATPEYARADCAAGLPPDRGRVPFIVASPKPITSVMPVTNAGLFAGKLPQ